MSKTAASVNHRVR
uniref:Uncharacterized protein n=1 Tax=Anguilla anguilla TaxID=7936 RepID=A0A0E9UK79_ANGAN